MLKFGLIKIQIMANSSQINQSGFWIEWKLQVNQYRGIIQLPLIGISFWCFLLRMNNDIFPIKNEKRIL